MRKKSSTGSTEGWTPAAFTSVKQSRSRHLHENVTDYLFFPNMITETDTWWQHWRDMRWFMPLRLWVTHNCHHTSDGQRKWHRYPWGLSAWRHTQQHLLQTTDWAVLHQWKPSLVWHLFTYCPFHPFPTKRHTYMISLSLTVYSSLFWRINPLEMKHLIFKGVLTQNTNSTHSSD